MSSKKNSTPTSGFSRRTEAKMESVLSAAMHLFRTQGISKTSMNAIADHSQVAVMSIYKYFESKNGLLRVVVERMLSDLVERYNKRFLEETSFRSKLSNLLHAKNVSIEREYWDVINEAVRQIPELSNLVGEYYENHFMKLFSGLISQGVEHGEVSPHYSEGSIQKYVSMYRDFYNTNPISQELSEKEREDFFNFFWYGLKGEEQKG